ncbi:hypothetical protein [Aminipila terrae]|uniref:Uncharacterized protein n=1 Tax=Aminipila terrae TaxID=2697030 RepID=A0A6P1MLT0_9FIRM|nr:hypothetical protein [Aminipila terrae]QHI73028.1 hypothetical protein Ami3637_11990 [Aminipila terrae]
MVLGEIDNNNKLVERLRYLSASENLFHAYVFEGDSCVNKALLADCFIKAILCENHRGMDVKSALPAIK